MKKKTSLHKGQVWVHVPDMNYRQSSGVEYRGKYISYAEYRMMIQRRSIAEDLKKKKGE